MKKRLTIILFIFVTSMIWSQKIEEKRKIVGFWDSRSLHIANSKWLLKEKYSILLFSSREYFKENIVKPGEIQIIITIKSPGWNNYHRSFSMPRGYGELKDGVYCFAVYNSGHGDIVYQFNKEDLKKFSVRGGAVQVISHKPNDELHIEFAALFAQGQLCGSYSYKIKQSQNAEKIWGGTYQLEYGSEKKWQIVAFPSGFAPGTVFIGKELIKKPTVTDSTLSWSMADGNSTSVSLTMLNEAKDLDGELETRERKYQITGYYYGKAK